MKKKVFKSFLSILLAIALLIPNFAFVIAADEVYTQAVNDDNIVLNKKTVPTDDPEIFRIDLETYAKGALTTNIKSADIVLILDISGSMANAYQDYAKIESESYIKTTSDKYYIYKDGKFTQIDYYTKYGTTREEGWYIKTSPSSSLVTADKLTFKLGGTGTDNEYQFYSAVKIDALKHSVTMFIDKLYSYTQDYEVDFRLAIVTFSTTSKVISGNCKADSGAYVSIKNDAQTLKQAVWDLTTGGDTYPGTGTQNALDIITDGYQNDRQLFTIFFGDGEASSTSTTTGSYGAVTDAYEMKNTYNAEVYSIGIFDSLPSETSNVYYLLNGISSNYPQATRPDKNYLGTQESSDYYIPATNFDGLDSAFEKITSAVGTPYEDLVVKDVVTHYFYISDAQRQAIKDAYPGQIEFVDNEDGTTEINIEGMDFPIVLCDDDGNPLDPNDPGIFRFSFYITIKEEFAGGNKVPTNTSESGVYTPDDNEIVEYPIPDVDIPIKYNIDAHDLSIYIGDTVSEADIFTNEDGKWMADLVQIEYAVKDSKGNPFTGTESLNKNETYTITATVTPLHEGDFEAVTFTANATVSVFKPTITFTDDFTIYKGEKADISDNYTVTWTCPENVNAPMPLGTAPALTVALKDKTGSVSDPASYGPTPSDATAVNYGINTTSVTADGTALAASDYTLVSVKDTPVSGSNFTVTVNPNLITYNLEGGKMESNPEQYTYGVGVTSFNPAEKQGYDFLYWINAETENVITSIPTTAKGDYELTAVYAAKPDTKYKVNHYTENLDGSWHLELTENLQGETDSTANAQERTFSGFTFARNLSTVSGKILADGSLVLNLYYTRNEYDLTVTYKMSDGSTPPDEYTVTLLYGEEYSVGSPAVVGYTPDRNIVEGTMPLDDVHEIVTYIPNADTKYKVLHYTENLDGTWKLENTDNFAGVTNTKAIAVPKDFVGFTFDKTLGKLSGNILADGSLVLEVYYTRNSYDLTVEYVMSDGTKAPEKYTATLKYEESYSVTSPDVLGYTADKLLVEGKMPADNVTEKVVYTPNEDTKYTVKHYTENLDGTWKLEKTENLTGKTNTTATAEPNEYTGFTFDETLGTLTGIIAADGSLVLEVYYVRNSYKVTVTYKMSDGTTAPEKYETVLKYGDNYSVVTPDVLGYTPDRTLVEGTVPANDVNEEVIYTPNSDTSYKVLHYTENLDGTWKLEETENLTGKTNTTATAEPNEYTGFTFDETLGTLTGIIAADGSLVLEVYYTRNSYDLTVEYVMSDGTKAPEKYTATLKYEESYSVTSPDVPGYTADKLLVEGKMPADDVTEKVVYTPNADTKYTVKHYTENLDGSWKLEETENLTGKTNTTATAEPNEYTGFTFDETLGTLSGNIAADGSLVLEVYYVRNSYKVTVTYKMSDGTTAPEKYETVLKYGDNYSVVTPDVLGYTPDRTLVEGTVPANDVNEEVIYTPNSDTSYKVLHYTENLDGTWKLEETENLTGKTNTTATAEPNEYTGFTFDETLGTLTGNIAADGSLVLEVYYVRNSYKVTVTYKMSDGTTAPEKYETVLKYGDKYSVVTPDVLGYTPDRTLVEGTVPANDVNEEVIYTPNSDTSYKVLHYTENLDGINWKLEETENLTGKTNTTATAEPNEYTGFTFDETLGTLTGNIAADGSLVLEVYYTRNSYDLTVEYVMSDGTKAPEKYTATLKYEESYSVTSPDVPGYTADKLLVEGKMPADDVTEKVVYTPNADTKYTVKHYTENLDGTWKLELTEVLEGTTNTTATAVPKDFVGFTFDKTLGKLSGNILADGSLVLEVYYTRNSYDLTVEYVMSDGTKTPEKYTATLKYEESYSVTSPEVLGYTADKLVVEGKMPADNVTEKVVYTPNEDTKYTVKHYTENLDGTWKLELTEVLEGTTNTTATAVPKDFVGFTFAPNKGTLSGNIAADGSLVLEVYYTRNSYDLTVEYVMSDGTKAPEKYTATLKYEESYSVTSPEVLGYTADKLVVEGKMPADNVTEKVVYTPNEDTKYTVKHYTENLDGTWKLELTEVLEGTTNTTATAVPKDFVGFTFDPNKGTLSGNIAADGSLVLEVYYTRNTHTITYTVDGVVYFSDEYKYGDTILPIIPPRKEGHEFVEWEYLPTTMPDKDVTVPAIFNKLPDTPVTNSGDNGYDDNSSLPKTGVELDFAMYLLVFMFATSMLFVLIKKRPENS